MVREVVALLPDAAARIPPGVAAPCAALGAGLWAVGGRYSRSVLALAGVTIGAVVGMKLPAWCSWQIDGMGLAVGGAIVLGAFAFMLHRTCIGLLLGAGMMLWAGVATWIAMGGDVYWNWRAVTWNGDLVQALRDLWQTLPPTLSRVFPAACFAGLAGGILIAVCLPRAARVLVHSLIGVTLAVVMGAIAAATWRPQWLAAAGGSNCLQGAMLIALVLTGAWIQWHLTPHRKPAGNAPGGADKSSNAARKS